MALSHWPLTWRVCVAATGLRAGIEVAVAPQAAHDEETDQPPPRADLGYTALLLALGLMLGDLSLLQII